MAKCFGSLILFLAIMWLSGCGGGASPPSGPPPTMGGNYFIVATSGVAPQNSFSLGGTIQSNPDNTLFVRLGFVTSPPDHAAPNATCFSLPNEMGTVNGQADLAISLLPPTGVIAPAISIIGQVTADGKTITGGTYTLQGGSDICTYNDHGTVTGFMVQSMTGTYIGSFVLNATTVNVSVVLTQIDSGSASFDLRATATFTNGNSCNLTSASTAFVEAEPTGSVRGVSMGFNLQDPINPGTAQQPNFIATFGGTASDSSANAIVGTIFIDDGPCQGLTAPLTLTRH